MTNQSFSASEGSRLDALASYTILDSLPEPEYDAITQLAAYVCQTPVASISFIGEHCQWLKAVHGSSQGQSAPRQSSFCTYAIQAPYQILQIPDARLDDRFCLNPAVTQEPYIVFYTGVPLVDQQGQALGTLCVVDYTARQLVPQQLAMLEALTRQVVSLLLLRRSKGQLEQAERTLQTLNGHLGKRNQVLKAVVDTCPARLALWQAVRQGNDIVDFRYDFSNPIDAAVKGLTSEQMIGQSLTHLFPQVLTSGFFDRLVAVLQTNQVQQYQQQRDQVDHTIAWGDITLTPCEDGVLFTAQDITQLKQTEADLRSHTADLTKVVLERTATINQLSALKQAILHYTGIAVISTDQDGVIQLVNPSAERLLGYQAQELMGHRLSPLLYDPDELAGQAQQLANQLGYPVQVDFNFFKLLADNQTRERTVRTKDGTLIPVLLTSTCILDEAGTVMGYVGIATDITPQKQAESMLQTALQREQELNKLKSQFVATASHEFRTPLATIQSSVELIKLHLQSARSGSDWQVAVQRHIGIIEKQISNYSELLTDVMTLGKIEAGRMAYNPQPVDLLSLAQELISTHYATRPDGRRVELLIRGQQRLLSLDAKLIRHALVNLLANAFKFSSQSPVLGIHFQHDHVVIQVVDKGIGIPAAELGMLFETFYRASNAIDIAGSGLGLVITRQFVERHGGHLVLQSEENVGTTVTLTLPAC